MKSKDIHDMGFTGSGVAESGYEAGMSQTRYIALGQDFISKVLQVENEAVVNNSRR